MTSELLSCCCGGGGPCCPCHPILGGRTSWLVTTTFSVTLFPNLSCQCTSQYAGFDPISGQGVPALMMVDPPIGRNGPTFTSNWVNPQDIFSCGMSGFTDPTAGAPIIMGQDYWPDPLGGCPYPIDPPFSTGVRVRRQVVVEPPAYPCPQNGLFQPRPWLVVCRLMGYASFFFRGGFNCTNPGPFVLDLSASFVGNLPITSSSGTIACSGGSVIANIGYSAGTVSLT